MNQILQFFNHPFFIIIGGIGTVIAILGFCYGIFIILSGVIPVWIRLGRGLSNKKIALYAENDFDDLRNLLVDSGLFKQKNIEKITKTSMKKGETHKMMLVNYPEFSDKISEILQYKKDSDSLIVYVPQDWGRIEDGVMKEINNNRNSIVVNLRGRLLNDIVVSLITTTI